MPNWLRLYGPCRACRSKVYKLRGSELYCDRGHLVQEYRDESNEVAEDSNLTGLTVRKKSKDSSQLAAKRKTRRVPRALASHHVYEIFQIALRKQTAALIKVLKCENDELMTAVMNLWLLFVTGRGIPTDRRRDSNVRIKKVGVSNSLRLQRIYHLVFMYLACLELRIPVLPSDFIKWAGCGEIPYLSCYQDLPKVLLDQFDRDHMLHVMGMNYGLPTVKRLISEINRLKFFYKRFSLVFPSPNEPLIVHMLVKRYELPAEVYFTTMVVSYIVRTFGMLERTKDYDDEAWIVTYAFIALRICYGLDGAEREHRLGPLKPDLIKQFTSPKHDNLSTLTAEQLDSTRRESVPAFLEFCQKHICHPHPELEQKPVEEVTNPYRFGVEYRIDMPQSRFPVPPPPATTTAAADGVRTTPMEIDDVLTAPIDGSATHPDTVKDQMSAPAPADATTTKAKKLPATTTTGTGTPERPRLPPGVYLREFRPPMTFVEGAHMHPEMAAAVIELARIAGLTRLQILRRLMRLENFLMGVSEMQFEMMRDAMRREVVSVGVGVGVGDDEDEDDDDDGVKEEEEVLDGGIKGGDSDGGGDDDYDDDDDDEEEEETHANVNADETETIAGSDADA